MQPYKQDSNQPVPKVAAVGISGVVLTVLTLIGGLAGFQLPSGLTDNITALVAGVTAFVSLVHFAVGYFTHDTKPVSGPGVVTPTPQPAAQPAPEQTPDQATPALDTPQSTNTPRA